MIEFFLVLLVGFWLLMVYCSYFNKPLGHKLFGHHYVDVIDGFDGVNLKGTCPGCGKQVMQDSQGNWF